MTIAVYPGSFDPITKGHMDIIEASSKIFDKVIVVVAENIDKKSSLPVDVRKKLVEQSVSDFSNVSVALHSGLTIDFAAKNGANVIVRGIRNSIDYEFEMQLAQNNHILNSNIQTVILPTKPEHSFISSSAVREIIYHKGDISRMVPIAVYNYFKQNSVL